MFAEGIQPDANSARRRRSPHRYIPARLGLVERGAGAITGSPEAATAFDEDVSSLLDAQRQLIVDAHAQIAVPAGRSGEHSILAVHDAASKYHTAMRRRHQMRVRLLEGVRTPGRYYR